MSTTPQIERTIDEYLRKRLMPVEGAIPRLAGIDMYGNSIPAGSVGGDLLSTSISSNAITLTRESQPLSSWRRNTSIPSQKARFHGTPWMTMCNG